jgi:hypothetical protein
VNIVVREADIDGDRRVLIDFLYDNLTENSDGRRFDWLYRDNPYGSARAWIMIDNKSKTVIGMAAAFPRLVQVLGQDIICWNMGDFAINKRFRSLGPAILLQRACLTPIQEGAIHFCYDHPSKSMMAIYKRMGILASGEVIRFSKPLIVDRQVSAVVKKGALARGIRALGNAFLALKDYRRQVYGGYEIALLDGRFNEEFTKLNDRVLGHFKVCGRRTSEYLNWRYLDNPLSRYEVITLRNGGELMAYAIFIQDEHDAVLLDLFGEQEENIMETLLRTVFHVLRARKICTLSAPVLDLSPLIPILKRTGFYARECSPWIVYTRPGGSLEAVVTEGKNWFLMHGDRDV